MLGMTWSRSRVLCTVRKFLYMITAADRKLGLEFYRD